MEAIFKRRSIRKYTKVPVKKEVLIKLVKAGMAAPSAGNEQPWHFIIIDHHKILIDMGLSHETLVYLCDLAIQNGALGAKVTGGGRGGYMVALTPGKELQDKVASIFEKENFKLLSLLTSITSNN